LHVFPGVDEFLPASDPPLCPLATQDRLVARQLPCIAIGSLILGLFLLILFQPAARASSNFSTLYFIFFPKERIYMRLLAKILVVALIFALPLVAVAQMTHDHQEKPSVTKAIAVLNPTKGTNVRGVVTFEVVEHGVRVVANVHGLAQGKHGFHVHEFGDCSSDSATSAGGHYNPANMKHGAPNSDMRHVGDTGNIEADMDGNAHLDYIDSVISLNGDYSIIGRAVIVHAKEDDLATQPTGAAGARVACGVIGVAKR
jgi:Cu-Zn family superoxide dismutase